MLELMLLMMCEYDPILGGTQKDAPDEDVVYEQMVDDFVDNVGDISITPMSVIEVDDVQTINSPQDNHITKSGGVFAGPSGVEKYYNLNMGGCVRMMRDKGYSLDEYPYWIRADGVKMFGDYAMVAMNTNIYPKGTIIETSMGTAMVVDHCVAAEYGYMSVDIAVTW